ncbi:MarR family winged helix-turn-helix transcriptional regulator [Radiobacillus sp. PE A8.2]|uniref:MarR family winged helix-turn-helix transcriptional regulator n=1 Tax=Radiobacillus sp. PE A8.2 TaxID=3380349 RepID=UPI00388DB80D
MRHQVGSEINTLLREINASLNHRWREAFKEYELTPPQMMIMFMLSEEEQLRISDISKKMSLANSTVSGIIDRLEKQGYVNRLRSEEDKRVVYIVPSVQVKELHESMRNMVTTFLGDLVDESSEAEKQQIVKGLTSLRNLVKKA